MDFVITALPLDAGAVTIGEGMASDASPTLLQQLHVAVSALAPMVAVAAGLGLLTAVVAFLACGQDDAQRGALVTRAVRILAIVSFVALIGSVASWTFESFGYAGGMWELVAGGAS